MPANPRRGAVGLGLLFGAIYFVQGVGEPVEGLVAQPVRSILKRWGHGDASIAGFSALLALPWSLKPVYGLLTDFVPIGGSRRRSYLILTSGATALGLGGAWLLPLGPGDYGALLGWLLVPTAAVAFADVVSDALMIEVGRPLGLTGRLQAVQWAAMYLATFATGVLGGFLAERGAERAGFLIGGGLSALTLVLALAFVREPSPKSRPSLAELRRTLGAVARDRGLWAVAAFLFLFNFNPFAQAVLYLHMTRALGLGEQFYGNTVALFAVACIAASVGYGLYGPRMPMGWLVRASVGLGIASNLSYLMLHDRPSALAATVAAGLAYMTATLIQLDLAARSCRPEAAGTTFALLMALENAANALSTALGGAIYQWGTARWGSGRAFAVLVCVGSAFTAGCWLLVRWLPRPDPGASLGGRALVDDNGPGGDDRSGGQGRAVDVGPGTDR